MAFGVFQAVIVSIRDGPVGDKDQPVQTDLSTRVLNSSWRYQPEGEFGAVAGQDVVAHKPRALGTSVPPGHVGQPPIPFVDALLHLSVL